MPFDVLDLSNYEHPPCMFTLFWVYILVNAIIENLPSGGERAESEFEIIEPAAQEPATEGEPAPEEGASEEQGPADEQGPAEEQGAAEEQEPAAEQGPAEGGGEQPPEEKEEAGAADEEAAAPPEPEGEAPE